MSAPELALWAAFYQLHPWGDYAADVRSAINGAVVARAMGASVDVEDLIPKWDQKSNQQVKTELFLLWCAEHNRRHAKQTT